MALPMLAGSGDSQFGLAPLSRRHPGDAIFYANNIHNATPPSNAVVGGTPLKGILGRSVEASVFHHFGCRVWACAWSPA
jgi:hypothetical protein